MPTKLNPNVVGAGPGQYYHVPVLTRIKEACDDKTSGYWRCLDHDQDFTTPISKDMHISGTSKHTLAWMCNHHGPETPGPQAAD